MRKSFRFFLAVGLSLAGAMGLISCNSQDQASAAAATEPAATRVAVVQRGNITHMLSLAGQFQPYQVVDVHPKITGFMREIRVDIGDRVHKGEILAVLEVPELRAQLQGTVFAMQQARDEIRRAEHEISQAQAVNAAQHANYVRLLNASKAQPGLIAQQELDDAQSKDLSSLAQVDAAKAAYDAAQQHAEAAKSDTNRVQDLQDYTNVVAPLDGVVIWRYADTGALIQSGTNSNNQDIPIVKISESQVLRLRMPVPENDVRYIHTGDPMEIRIDALNRSITGSVVRFTRNVSFETRTMETEVDVPNNDLSIDPGMYANAALQLASAKHALTIPVEAIVLKDGQNTVYVVGADGKVHIRFITTGIRGSKLVEVRSGLEEGEQVILGGQEKYNEGERVSPTIVKTAASEDVHEAGGVIDMRGDAESTGGAS